MVVSYRHTCPTCGRAFQRATGLERHRRSAHTKEKPYACEYCSQTYSRIDLLQRHISLYHKEAAAGKCRLQDTLDFYLSQSLLQGNASQPAPLFDSQLAEGVMPVATPSTVPFSSASTPLQLQSPGQEIDQSLLSWFYGGGAEANANVNITSPSPCITQSCSTMTEASMFLFASPGFETIPSTSDASSSANSASSSVMTPGGSSPLLDASASSSDNSSTGAPPSSTVPVSSGHLRRSVDIQTAGFPAPRPCHLDLYRRQFAKHLPFIHLPSLDNHPEGDELEDDLRRAMAIVGGNFGGELESEAGTAVKACDFYGCGLLKAKVLRSIEDLQDQVPETQTSPSRHVLLRRTQTMVLLQLVAMFSESKSHKVAAKLSHGALITVARELLHELDRSACNLFSSWIDWSVHEETVRTLWAVYIVDSLQSFCFQRSPWLSLSELSQLPDLSSDELWNTSTESEFNRHFVYATGTQARAYESIFDLVSGIREDASSLALPKSMSLSGILLAVVSIVTEIMGLLQEDQAARKQFAARLQRADTLACADRDDLLRTLRQALQTRDADLQQHVDKASRSLTRWLSFLHLSATQMSQTKGSSPFMCDFMPWYWAGAHFLGVLRRRTCRSMQRQSTSLPSADLADILSSVLAQYTGNTAAEGTQSSLEIMYILVRIRLSLNSLDGGASMQCAIGSPRFAESLPLLPASVRVCSITGLFPGLVSS